MKCKIPTRRQATAVIDESLCIGCTLCIEACPFDAIVGAARLMHTVIARDCTGCELCIPPCPVDCISLVPTGKEATREERRIATDAARERFRRREARLARDGNAARRRGQTAGSDVNPEIVRSAIERARQRLALRKTSAK